MFSDYCIEIPAILVERWNELLTDTEKISGKSMVHRADGCCVFPTKDANTMELTGDHVVYFVHTASDYYLLNYMEAACKYLKAKYPEAEK